MRYTIASALGHVPNEVENGKPSSWLRHHVSSSSRYPSDLVISVFAKQRSPPGTAAGQGPLSCFVDICDWHPANFPPMDWYTCPSRWTFRKDVLGRGSRAHCATDPVAMSTSG